MGITAVNQANSTSACIYLRRVLAHSITQLLLVVLVALSLLKILDMQFPGPALWWPLPLILITASLFPAVLQAGINRQPDLLQREAVLVLGLNLHRWRFSIFLLSVTSVIIFPLLLVALWLIKSIGLEWPLIPAVRSTAWLSWILYQLMYVAVAEEIFFRGLILGTLLRIPTRFSHRSPRLYRTILVLLTAAIFALAHVLLTGTIVSALTFFPGLIMGWLFIRTHSLLAPVLFHALANIFYALTPFILS